MERERRVIALGFFDGIHIGHQALFSRTKERAAQLGATPSVISFDEHPENVVFGCRRVSLINTPEDRVRLIKSVCGIDDTIFLHFDEEMMRMPWESFAEWVVEHFGAVHLVAGYDFTCGYKGEGTAEKLREKCARMGVGCDIVDAVKLDGVVISSSMIREKLENGEITTANRYLGHMHIFTDSVQYGYKLGRKLGVPTINMRFPDGMIEMVRGVYATRAYLEDGRYFDAVTNIGVRPTVSGGNTTSVESHLLDYSGYLYGQKVTLEFYRFLRREEKFDDIDALQHRIMADIADVREYFAENGQKADK